MTQRPPTTADRLTVAGFVTVTVMDADTGNRLEVIEARNLIVDGGLTALAAAVTGASAQLSHCAIGTGTTAPASTDVTLDTETFRKPVTNATPNGTGRYLTDTYIAPGEANFTWDEVGWFIAGTATPDSGTLYARVLLNVAKTSGVSVLVRREDIVTT